MTTSKQKSKFAKRIARPPRANKRAQKAARSTKTAASEPKRKAAAQTSSVQGSDGSPSKKDTVLSLLRQSKGTTIVSVVQATGWQPHSVRGFFAGVIKKKLKLNLLSEKVDGQRVYRIGTTTRAR